MNKRIKQSISLLLFILLVGCASIATSPTTEHTSIIATEKIVALTKVPMITGEAQTETEESPKNNATITAIMATKFAFGTESAETMTAMPTETPTPSIPTDSPPCTPSHLKTSFGSNGATGNIFLFANFTNISSSPCYMPAWPQVILVDEQGNPLDVDYGYMGFENNASGAATEQARDAATAGVGLWPGWQASIALIWYDYRTWCGAAISGNIVIRLKLMGNLGMIDVQTDFQPGAVCDTPGQRTNVIVSKLNIAPPP
jgi:uncharacterized protein YceK